MRTGALIILWLLMVGLTLTQGNIPSYAREMAVVPTSAIVPPTYTAVASPTVVVATSTVVAGGNVSATQTAAAQTATATATAVGATSTAIVIVVTSTPVPTAAQPGRLPNTGVVDGIEVWQNQPLVLVMAVTGILGLVFLFYGQRH